MSVRFFYIFLALSQFIHSERPNYVFDLSGSFQGYGDIIGPWSALYGLKKKRPDANYVGIVDSRARDVLEDTYRRPLAEISKDFGVIFYNDQTSELVPKADFYFQLFFGGRRIKNYEDYGTRNFINPHFCDSNTVTVISDTMHGGTLDEVVGPGFTLYFKPPGIGVGRSGILNSSDLDKLINLAPLQQKEIAASLFDQPELKDLILSRGLFHGVKLSFMYGLHNESFNKALIGQSAEFIEGLAEYHTQDPVVVLSPQKLEILKALMPPSAKILTLAELGKIGKLQNKIYVLQLPALSNFQFSALMAGADLPMLLEGNNAISQAIRLQKEFLVLRSPWNKPQIQDLLDVDSELGGPWIYPGIYNLSDDSKPRFKAYFEHQKNDHWVKKFFQQYALSQQVPNFVDKLNEVVSIATKLRYSKLGASELKRLASGTTDQYLAYSIAALSKGAIQVKNVDTTRLKPNKPNFSLKIELLDKSEAREYAVNYYIVNLKRSPERRAYMQRQFDKIPGIKPVFIEAVDGKTLPKHSHLKPGEVGIYQTTKDKIIPLAVKGDISVILEDDVVLPKNFPEEVRALLRDAPPNWDIIYLGCHENVYADANGKTSPIQTEGYIYNLCPSSVLQESADRIKKIKSGRCIAGTWGYMINHRSAVKIEKLLAQTSMIMPVDNQFSRLTGDDKLDSYCVSPQVVHPNDALESTIR